MQLFVSPFLLVFVSCKSVAADVSLALIVFKELAGDKIIDFRRGKGIVVDDVKIIRCTFSLLIIYPIKIYLEVYYLGLSCIIIQTTYENENTERTTL